MACGALQATVCYKFCAEYAKRVFQQKRPDPAARHPYPADLNL